VKKCRTHLLGAWVFPKTSVFEDGELVFRIEMVAEAPGKSSHPKD
jgi:hypothetical protein